MSYFKKENERIIAMFQFVGLIKNTLTNLGELETACSENTV